jgi:hypothetical protein
VKVCELGKASQHSEKLRGECKILTRVPENERMHEGFSYKMRETKYYYQ